MGSPEEGWTIRVNVTKKRYFWDDTVLLYVTGSNRYIEDDLVEFVSGYTGPYTYESVMGGDITVPGFLNVAEDEIRLL